MSLKSVATLIDDKLHEIFHRKQPDAKRVRDKALKTIETARRQFASSEPTRGRKVWVASNEVVRFTPGYRISERDTVYVPAARFGEMLDGLQAAIKAGELDDALLADQAKASAPAGAPIVTKRTRSPEATAKAIATRAANKAAKAGEAAVAKVTKPKRAKPSSA